MKNGLCLSSMFSVRPGLSLRNPDTSGSRRAPKTLNADHPEPIRGNPRLRAETCASGLAGNTGLNGDCNTRVKCPKSLQRVAPCCSVLHCVSPKFSSEPPQHRPPSPLHAVSAFGLFSGMDSAWIPLQPPEPAAELRGHYGRK